jgi:hypothetical protein
MPNSGEAIQFVKYIAAMIEHDSLDYGNPTRIFKLLRDQLVVIFPVSLKLAKLCYINNADI